MARIGKKSLSLLLTVLLLVSLFTGLGMQAMAAPELPAHTADGTMTELAAGSVTAAGIYSIASASELRALSDWINAGNTGEGYTFYLTEDIDLGGESSPWVPIGQIDGNLGDLDVKAAFFGTFDGQGHSITGLYVGGEAYSTGSGRYSAGNGLFGQNFGTVENVYAEVEVNTYRQGGAIVGVNFGTVRYCASAGKISANGGGGSRGTGGIVGSNYGTVEACWSSATVYNAYRRAGGIVGYNASEQADMAAHGTWNSRGEEHLSDEPASVIGAIYDSFFIGYASSASKTYSGGIAATNDEECTISNCWWLEGSAADDVGYYEEAEGATGTFDSDGLVTGSTTTLLEALHNDAFVDGGRYPVLYWAQDGESDAYTVTLAQPEAGGSLWAVWGEKATPIRDSAAIPAGETVTLTASTPEDGYFFSSFTLDGAAVKGKSQADGSYTVTWNVTGDALLTAAYTSFEDDALTVATQAGEAGALVTVKTYSWKDLFSMAEEGAAGYMYTHGTDGWNIVGATRWVTVADLFADAGLKPAGEDEIVAMASDGSPRVIPTWEQISASLYFYPQASDLESFPTEGAVEVPAAVALDWTTVKSGSSAGDMLADAARSACFTGSLRFVYGSAEADYIGAANASGTLTGNRLWSGVVTLAVRSAGGETTISVFGEDVALSTLKEQETARTLTHAKKGEIAVKGITALDLITKIAGEEADAYASLTFTAADGFSTTVTPADAAWEDVMLIWEGNGASDESLYSAVEGGSGKQWVSGVVAVTGEKAEETGGEGGEEGEDSGKDVVLKVQVKEGKDGDAVLLKEYEKEELTALSVTNADGWAYLFYKGEGWSAIVATELLELDTLLADSGAADYWESGAYLEFTCSDGVYGKSYPTYDDIAAKNLFVSDNGGSSLVPAGLAVTWASGTLDEVTEDAVAILAGTAYDSGSLRFVYGISSDQFEDSHNAPAGARMPTGVLELTVVYAEEDAPDGSVGTSKDLEGEEEEKKNGEEGGSETGETGEAPSFQDVAGHWAEEDILYTAEKQLMIGYPDGLFHPERSFSRAMLTQVLWRMAGKPAASAAAPFADVAAGSWCADAVAWAAETGIVEGVGGGRFDPDGDVTREQMVLMLYRYCESTGLDVSGRADLSVYADAERIHSWALNAMAWAVDAGLIQGRPDGTLDPAGTANRAEAATLLARFCRAADSAAAEDAAEATD